MPIYEYGCQECNSVFEVKQKFDDEPITECIHCGGKVEKLISASGFSLKGEGWGRTGYGRKPTWHDHGEKYYDKSLAKHCSYRAKGQEPPSFMKADK
ncbi:MAG: zinc ribbon domain-containing protein [Desulfuromonadaceae bacterium]|nr:zinc ribbon domain-containing protein [Desulfuromonadaceae bacterium]